MKLADLKDALLKVTDKVFHFEAHEQSDQYIVWSEDGALPTYADNKSLTKIITGTIDYFTKKENDIQIWEIEQVLNDLKIAHKLNSIQHEKDTGFIHYEWTWEMIIDG